MVRRLVGNERPKGSPKSGVEKVPPGLEEVAKELQQRVLNEWQRLRPDTYHEFKPSDLPVLSLPTLGGEWGSVAGIRIASPYESATVCLIVGEKAGAYTLRYLDARGEDISLPKPLLPIEGETTVQKALWQLWEQLSARTGKLRHLDARGEKQNGQEHTDPLLAAERAIANSKKG